ncbi:hypothetical protein HKD37_10G027527 [Glycine soja]
MPQFVCLLSPHARLKLQSIPQLLFCFPQKPPLEKSQPRFEKPQLVLSSWCANSILEDPIFEPKHLGSHHFVSELSVSLRSGAMERSSSSYTSEVRSRVFCLCNIETPLVTSWTKENPGRRFYGCGLYKARNINLDTGRKGCNFFQWHDPVGNNRQKKIIVGLMKEVDELKLREKDLQTMISEMKMKEKCLWIVLVVCWVSICDRGRTRVK